MTEMIDVFAITSNFLRASKQLRYIFNKRQGKAFAWKFRPLFPIGCESNTELLSTITARNVVQFMAGMNRVARIYNIWKSASF